MVHAKSGASEHIPAPFLAAKSPLNHLYIARLESGSKANDVRRNLSALALDAGDHSGRMAQNTAE